MWLHPSKTVVFAIDINAHDAEPELVQLEALTDDLKAGLGRLVTGSCSSVIVKETSLPEQRKVRRDRAWQLISSLVMAEPNIYYPKYRAQKVAECMTAGMVTRRTIYKYLRRYWQRGQTPK